MKNTQSQNQDAGEVQRPVGGPKGMPGCRDAGMPGCRGSLKGMPGEPKGMPGYLKPPRTSNFFHSPSPLLLFFHFYHN
jgi:hypothetical protein